ncbi:MAG TPA: hypothetical protein VE360_17650 [Pyrinomonadaceae bacterium]|nr:hypothetical protein [Pyrinomonadaceae bacterium]
MKMNHLKLIAGAAARERLRWAREHLYSLLILSPLVLGLTYFGVGRMVSTNEDVVLTPLWSAALAFVTAAGLILLSMSRASAEVYHLRSPLTLFDTLAVAADTHLYAALVERVARTSAVGAAALVARTVFGGTLADARLAPPLILFVVLVALAEVLAALAWVHWSRARKTWHAAAAVAALAACAFVAGLLLVAVVKPERLAEGARAAALVAGSILTGVLLGVVRALHRSWRGADMEHAKRLGAGERGGLWWVARARKFFKEAEPAALFERDLRLTLRAFSSAVYAAFALAVLWVAALAAALTTGLVPAGDAPPGVFDMTWLPRVVAVKVACVLAAVALASLTPVLVAHQAPHLWLERAVGAKGADVWRAKLWYARAVALPAPLAAWAVGVLGGAVPLAYVLPLLAEVLWLWWLVGTIAGALAYEVPEQPGLGVVMVACAGLAAGLTVAALWPLGLALYGFGVGKMCLWGEHRARFYLLSEVK